MRIRLIVASLAILAAPLEAQPTRAAHGTYALWICPKGCARADTASAAVAGVLVLSQSPITLDALPLELRRESALYLMPDHESNACFNLKRRGDTISSMAGIQPRAATKWSQRGDTITVLLYQSPDASFRLTAVIDGNTLRGLGRESGFIMQEFDNAAGDAHGVRVGAADVRRCIATIN
jgi:hypothetical protein